MGADSGKYPIFERTRMGVGLVFVVIVRFALRWKQKILREPLRLSVPAVQQRVNGRDLVMIRAVLGRGRRMKLEQIEAWVHSDQGEPRQLTVDWIPEVVVGPWTIAVEHPQETGVLELKVVGLEQGRQHETESRWDLSGIQTGSFEPVCGWKGGRFCGRNADWDTVKPCGSSS